ncbi:hypothetical protein AAC387_Pa06g1497 [Persea americana]
MMLRKMRLVRRRLFGDRGTGSLAIAVQALLFCGRVFGLVLLQIRDGNRGAFALGLLQGLWSGFAIDWRWQSRSLWSGIVAYRRWRLRRLWSGFAADRR